MKRKPLAVVISDVHYSLSTYRVADKCFSMAVDKAAELGVPLIDNGDLTNDKAILRAEYANALIAVMRYAGKNDVRVFLNVGNHSLLNEKGVDHALHFLTPYCDVVSSPVSVGAFSFIPYQNDATKFMGAIQKFPKGSIVFGHQGTIGGQLGDYVKDPSAIDPEQVKDWRVFLGHYHSHYELLNTVSVGNPYTLTFGEANDPEKGFLIVYDDGSYERVLTEQRRHVILEMTAEEVRAAGPSCLRKDDLVWLKVRGPYSELEKLKKREIGERLFGHANFKLDKIYTDTCKLESRTEKLDTRQILDLIIDSTDEGAEQKAYLKGLAKEVLS